MKLATGIDALDRRLSGGLDPGSVLAIVAPPASQSEAVIHELMGERATLYVSTLRRPEAVREGLPAIENKEVVVDDAAARTGMDNELARQITGSRSHSFADVDATDPLDDVYEAVASLDGAANLVLDPTNPLERTEDLRAYRAVLTELQSVMLDTGGLGVLHCITQAEPPALRETTLQVADVVWELELVSLSNTVEYRLTVPKNRGGSPILEQVTVMMDPDVWVDDSRTI